MPTYPFSSPGIGEVKLSLQSVDLQIEKENINQKHDFFVVALLDMETQGSQKKKITTNNGLRRWLRGLLNDLIAKLGKHVSTWRN